MPPFVDPAFADALAGQHREDRTEPNRAREHKARALCRQAQRALSLALAGECGDDVLRELEVVAVAPAPDAGHLLVSVTIPRGTSVLDVLERLARATPLLRHAVARAITRKRAPSLSFAPAAAASLPPPGEEVGDAPR